MLLSTVDSCDVNLTGLCGSTNLHVYNHTETSRTVHHANLFVKKSYFSDYPIKNYSCINKSAYIYNNYTTNSSILYTLFCPNTNIIVPIWTLPLFTVYVYILLFTNLKDCFIRVYYQQSNDHPIICDCLSKNPPSSHLPVF